MVTVGSMMVSSGVETSEVVSRKRRAGGCAGKGFFEFFAGIGLVHMGLTGSGWKCRYANDFDPDKYEMYRAKFPDAEEYFHLEDVWNTEAVISRLRRPALLATASFPCVDLSVAGHYKGLNGEHSSTFFAFTAILAKLRELKRQPPIVMLENVRGFLSSNGGADFEQACQQLSDLGYFIDALVIDAKHFTPQSRPRVFVIGMRDRALPPQARTQRKGFQLGDPWLEALGSRPDIRPWQLQEAMRQINLKKGWVAFDLPALPSRVQTLDEIIDVDEGQEWWDDVAVKKHLDMMHDYHRREIEAMLASREKRVVTIFRRKRHGSMRAEVRFDGLAGCLRTPRGGSARQIVLAIDGGKLRMRWMSPREYARLQGAGDYPITVAKNQAMYGFGDAVCVQAVKWIDDNILTPVASKLLTPAS
jgi:DNA (cytosine-5)-methyltransferase 1